MDEKTKATVMSALNYHLEYSETDLSLDDEEKKTIATDIMEAIAVLNR